MRPSLWICTSESFILIVYILIVTPQGGVNSSDFYKLYNNEQLKTAQESKLGVDIGSGIISAIGQADDVVLVSDSLYSLQLLVTLTELYCSKFRVLLEPSKTKLLCYSNHNQKFLVDYALNTLSPLTASLYRSKLRWSMWVS